MLAGPVAYYELVRIARKRRTYVLRFLFGLIVLGVINANYPGNYPATVNLNAPRSDPGVISLSDMAEFGQTLFWSIMAAQAALVLLLTPAMVADAIASERQTKTLHYLMASRLTGVEIVLGKLAARLTNLFVFLALVLPIMSLLTLVGGISPASLFLGDAALASAAYFLAGVATFASVMSKRPRDAVGAAYLMTACWLFVPPIAAWSVLLLNEPFAGYAREAVGAINWVWPASPTLLLTDLRVLLGGGANEVWRAAWWMIGSQLVYGTLFVALSAWQLRPAFRRHEGSVGRLTRATRVARRLLPVRRCGDDPVFWKEAYFTPSVGGFSRRLTRVAGLALAGLVVGGVLYESEGAFREVWRNGYGFVDDASFTQREWFNFALRVCSVLLFGIWILWLGRLSAAGFSSEREQDTWISLVATPLEADEILRAKMLGPLRATAPFGVTVVAIWLIGLASGAVHPLGFVAAVAMMGLFIWFVAALGSYISLKSKITWRAQLWTQGILIAPHVCCALPIPSALVLVWFSIWSYSEVHGAFSASTNPADSFAQYFVYYYVVGVVIYSVATFLLTIAAGNGVDALAGRPKRPLGRGSASPLGHKP